MNFTKFSKSMLLMLSITLLAVILSVTAFAETVGTTGGTETLNLFNSGCTGNGNEYSYYSNPAPATFTNKGYDLYMDYYDLPSDRMGLSFTINDEIVDRPVLTVYAFDVDEGSGERDVISLYDETTGKTTVINTSNSSRGYLSGYDRSWSTTTFEIEPSVFQKGHTYHFINTETVSGWVVYIRRVSLTLTTSGEAEEPEKPTISSAEITSASISSSGTVSATVKLTATETMNVNLECTATINGDTRALATSSATVTGTGITKTLTTTLESGSPKGTYRIDVIVSDTDGNTLATATKNAGYSYSAVTYNSNGGTNIVPRDTTSYASGNTVTVLFTSIPTKTNYKFLGWSRSATAATPEFTATGTKTFKITGDTTLYAVWGAAHNYVTYPAKAPTCTAHGWKEYTACDHCGDTTFVYLAPLGHSYTSEVMKEATCTEKGSILYTCSRCNDTYTVRTQSEHNYTVTVIHATCTQDGSIVYTCTKCNDVYTETIPAGHDYVAEITKIATSTQEGLITYTCSRCGDTYTEVIPMRPKAEILLIQDRLPWDGDNATALLKHLVNNGYITGWDAVTSSTFFNVDLSDYSVIYIANDQTTATYNQLSRLNNALTNFANAGGVVVYGACDNGWAGGNINYLLPGEVTKIKNISRRNYILDGDHPVVTGSLTDAKPITNALLDGTYCSHTSFEESTLPNGYNVILEDGYGQPTLAEYPVGDGYVFVSGLTWEFYYTRNYNASTSYSKNVFDDLLVYAVYLSDGNICEHEYDAGTEVDATCETQGYTLHTCSKCGNTHKDTFVEPLGHDFGEWITDVEPTATEYGSKHRECSRCSAKETASIDPIGEEEKPEVTGFILSDESAKPGETVTVDISLKSTEKVNSIALASITYDKSILEFVAFTNYEDIAEISVLPPAFDEELMTFVIALPEPIMFDGHICSIEFKVKDNATDCTTEITATPLTKNDSEVIPSTADSGIVSVYTYLKGDIDMDGDVDVDDAVLLFQHSMLPTLYPITYPGDTDFTHSGHVDIKDAVLLFRYSMLPDLYPID